MKVGDKIRIKKPVLLSQRTGRTVNGRDLYLAERIKDGQVMLAYSDGFVPTELRNRWFDISLFDILPDECPWNINDTAVLVKPDRIANGQSVFLRGDPGNSLFLYRGYPVCVIALHRNMTDWVQIHIEQSDIIIWMYADAIAPKIVKNLPDWF